ncbi:hypothetical protein PBCVFr5L_241R [Paramecium bursaria Chlorella virus Fr5L]|uniref:Uncharacterized protein n=1 Tax=Paramecium bursaria Chlorella virus CVA-1 TaxID=42683 RepID=M1HF43_9PHYC|nr:hypothetical protein F8205_gp082 [Paramecium bursaria Chlorella virus CVA-1]AGE48751.1 hypothetical protein PBCVAP110A_250R [Paramecium bursaria Chlorella virus AP110A]AGE51109.1 hypothetical protein PBCVCVG1_239R [Paramecium bursaria Chlorella virus CVG-1]AGE52116.1 hypothetical protein PBCVCVR1_247R [Paramecium bursaria Chlorella virus CVR-1]AGE53125.1 hypothetical protein PBCVFr5L_241R [Paramecium bursaria Chlorella virus Fr5L]AGE50437.1 hypothetical protein PBCVCVA1_240R [Paramecium bur
MANIDNSIARFSASMTEINAAKRHTVVIDLPVRKAVAGKTTKVVIKKAPAETTQAPKPKPAPKPAQTTERKEYVMPAKKTVKKTSKLGKLVSGKKVFDFSH